MPVWALIVALLIAVFFLLPVGIIYSITNIAVGLNVVTEFIIGYMVPGKPLAMMFFKTYGYITNNQAVTFAQDMKLGHYMKIKPRLLFWAQMLATIWGSLVQIGVLRWAYGSIDNLCDPQQKNHYTCPNGRVFFQASVIWAPLVQREFSVRAKSTTSCCSSSCLDFCQWSTGSSARDGPTRPLDGSTGPCSSRVQV